MSGEESKSSGEVGEKLAGNFLNQIGWGPSVKNVSLECAFPEEHGKKSHGDDRLFIYNSPFNEEITEIVHISVKHIKSGYPNGAQGFRTKLKDHLIDLANIVACGSVDAKVKEIISSFPGKPRKNHRGLLVWLHSNDATLDNDRRQDLTQMQVPEQLARVPAVLIDTSRASFIYHSLEHFKSTGLGDVSFYYPRLGSSPPTDPARSGKILPIELMASDVLPIKASIQNRPALFLYVRDSFGASALKKALCLAMAFGDTWVEDINIGFSNYNETLHSQEKDAALMSFTNSAERINVFCYRSSLLNMTKDA